MNKQYDLNSDQSNLNVPEKITSNKIWLFNSAGSFSGNVKYLFLYIVKNRPDIFACYITADLNNYNYIKELGYRVCTFVSEEGIRLQHLCGVYVNEQCKEVYPDILRDKIILNLYHGVGLKSVEKKCLRNTLSNILAKKYIKYNEMFTNNMCFLVTSPFMEKHFKNCLDLRDDQIIRGPYPRNVYSQSSELTHSYEFENIVKRTSKNEKIILYCPTFRESIKNDFLSDALGDIKYLQNVLKINNEILIIKLHNRMSSDYLFNRLKDSREENIIVWNNKYDIYEIFSKIDVAIVDYSSIYYDLLEAGVKKFIRYIFDYENEKNYLIYDYISNTSGMICNSFDELIYALNHIDSEILEEKNSYIREKFFSYENLYSLDDLIKQVLNFKKSNYQLDDLYSFDIFDTLIKRKCGKPEGIFFYVLEKIRKSDLDFPEIFKYIYPKIRRECEKNVRENYQKNFILSEIQFKSIFDYMSNIYCLSKIQIFKLEKWELEAEYDNVEMIEKNFLNLQSLVMNKKTVILISDMYLPKKFIKLLLVKANPLLAKLPIFLSSDLGYQKSDGKLYLEVYKHYAPWSFKNWYHFGDNKNSDIEQAKKIGINTTFVKTDSFNKFENSLINFFKSYDGFCIASLFRDFRVSLKHSEKDYFAYTMISSFLFPYISWVLNNAVTKNLKTLYFISRDGYILKIIADAIIKYKRFNIKTKYFYGSRKVWRVSSQINQIDDEFFSYFGNLVGVHSYYSLLESLHLTEQEFKDNFSILKLNDKSKISPKDLLSLREFFKNSKKYHEILLEKASKERRIVCDYIKKNIDFSEKFAFVEFWGRGYTQDCLTNLLEVACDKIHSSLMYYFRSINFSTPRNIRINYTSDNTPLLFMEAIFANHPYGTVLGYKYELSKIVSIQDRQNFDSDLFYSIEHYLPKFVNDFYNLKFCNSVSLVESLLSNFSYQYYLANQDDKLFVNCIAPLKYTGAQYGLNVDFAPKFTEVSLELLKKGQKESSLTKSIKMSLARSTAEIRKQYLENKKNETANKITLSKDTKKNNQNINLDKTRYLRLLNKLEKSPKLYFLDSKNTFSYFIYKMLLNKYCYKNMGQIVILLTKLWLKMKL